MPRELKPEELRQAVEDLDFMADWNAVKAFAEKWFDGAAKVTIECGSEYNDEGGYYPTVESVTAYNAAGETLEEKDDDGYDDEKHELPAEEAGTTDYDLTTPPTTKFGKIYVDA